MSYDKIMKINWEDGNAHSLTTSGAGNKWLTYDAFLKAKGASSISLVARDQAGVVPTDWLLTSDNLLTYAMNPNSECGDALLQDYSNQVYGYQIGRCTNKIHGTEHRETSWKYTSNPKPDPGVTDPTFYPATDGVHPQPIGAQHGQISTRCNNTQYPGVCHWLDQGGVAACCQIPVENKGTAKDNQIIDKYCAPDYDPRPEALTKGSYCVDVMTRHCEDHWQPGGECATWLGLNPVLGKAVVDNTLKNYINQKIASSGIKKGYYNPEL